MVSTSLTRAVRFFTSTIRAGTTQGAPPQMFFTPDRFPYFLGMLAVSSFTLGWKGMDIVRDENVSED
jgi:hypothetical protein